jgi:pimeloyl-ACP methyl ester carboxylesterase
MFGHFISSQDGTLVHFTVSGVGKPLVIVPGTLTPLAGYRSLVERLAHRFQVVQIFRRGYGATELGPSPCRFEYQVGDLATVLDTLAGPAVVFGHSFGGLVSLGLASIAPWWVERLVLYEPPVALIGNALQPMLRICEEYAAIGKFDDVVRLAFRVSGLPDFRDSRLTERIVAQASMLVPGFIADLECVTEMTLPSKEWAAITVPTLLMMGERTSEEYTRSVALLRAINPAVRFEILAGQAHFPKDMGLIADLIESPLT